MWRWYLVWVVLWLLAIASGYFVVFVLAPFG